MAWGEELGQEETEGTHLDLNKFLESKICRNFLFHREQRKV